MAVILPYAARVSTPALPYRGHAPVTWDTKSIADLKNTVDTHNHDGRYSPSALTYYLECNNGDGTNTLQTIPNATWRKLDVAGPVAANPGGGFNAGTDIYTIPGGGIYVCQALVRIKDGFAVACNLGIGWHTSEIDGYWFQWNKYVTGSGGRCALDYTRIAAHAFNDQYRLYCFQDSGSNMDLTAINLSVFRIG
jgi:hypothetical protein